MANKWGRMSCLSLLLALSLHIGLEGDYNSIHPHARCEIEHNYFNSSIAGVYYNSEEKVSAYVGKKFGALELGLVTGYSGYDVAPMLRFIKDGWFVAPSYETTGNVGLAIGFEVKLGEYNE